MWVLIQGRSFLWINCKFLNNSETYSKFVCNSFSKIKWITTHLTDNYWTKIEKIEFFSLNHIHKLLSLSTYVCNSIYNQVFSLNQIRYLIFPDMSYTIILWKNLHKYTFLLYRRHSTQIYRLYKKIKIFTTIIHTMWKINYIFWLKSWSLISKLPLTNDTCNEL